MFPSPTGVNHYELLKNSNDQLKQEISFRPLQGLTIMNKVKENLRTKKDWCFRPQQGLSIMNLHAHFLATWQALHSFRPQQGLSIMN